MVDECIHGLEGRLCDQCFPPAPPVASAVPDKPARARTSNTASTLRSTPSRVSRPARRSTSSSLSKPLDDVGVQRIYHVTHRSNLAGILAAGQLLADANEGWKIRPLVDISTGDARRARREMPVAGRPDLAVANYVPFFLTPDSAVWSTVRARTADPRLAIDFEEFSASDFVMLVSTVKTVVDHRADDEGTDAAAVVVTDGDAAHALTRFASTRLDADRMLHRLRADKDSPAILSAEFLVQGSLPFELVSLVGVANDRARDEVKDTLHAAGFRPKVSVYPPWFQPAE